MSQKHNPEMLMTLYKSTIRFIFEYGAICTVTAADCHHEKLQLIQNQALRVILNTPTYVAINDLHDASGLTPIKKHLIEFGKKRLKSLVSTSPIMEKSIKEYHRVQRILENTSPLDILSL